MSWIKVLLLVTPVVGVLYDRCSEMGLSPALPILGLLLGVVAEMQR
jgi:hypothetical protein